MWGNKERNSGSDGETREEGAIPARRGRGQDPALRLQKTQGKHTLTLSEGGVTPTSLYLSHGVPRANHRFFQRPREPVLQEVRVRKHLRVGMALEQWLDESLGPTRPWDTAQPPVVPHTPRCPGESYTFTDLGAGDPVVGSAGQGRGSALERAWGGRNFLIPVAASLNEPPSSLPPLSLALLKQAPGPQEADASEVCSGSCVQACVLKGPACPPTQGHSGVHPGPRSPAPARAQMVLAHLHHARAQQTGRPELTRWGRGTAACSLHARVAPNPGVRLEK